MGMPGDAAGAPFASILCGVEGNPSSTEAARQAIALASAGASLHFISVYTSFELSPDYTREALGASLEEVSRLAEQAGIAASTELKEGKYAIDVLLPESRQHDLLALGTHGNTRAGGIFFGSTASEAAHRAERALLIARQPREPAPPFGRVVLASGGSPGSWAPARAAFRVAAAFGSELEIVHVADGEPPERRAVVEAQAAEAAAVIGAQPLLGFPSGEATEAIVEAARAGGASVIVCGRRGVQGVKALGSVSERLVHQADCSVILVPAGGEENGG
jgi:nucleotide-binding universal stress UspA family protein